MQNELYTRGPLVFLYDIEGTVVYVGEYKETPCIHYLGPK